MSPSDSAFDAYYKWLGIPPEDQPANHYRLLAIPVFTSDMDVIANAADQRMGHVRSFQASQHSALSQELLNEISQARLCLLDPKKRAAYDQALKAKLGAKRPLSTPNLQSPRPDDSMLPGGGIDIPASYSPRRPSQRSEKKPPVKAIAIFAGSTAALTIGYFVLSWLSPSADLLGVSGERSNAPVVSGEGQIPETSNTSQATLKLSKRLAQENKLPLRQETSDDPSPTATPSADSRAPRASPEPRPTRSPADEQPNRLRQLHADRDSALARSDVESTWKAVDAIVAHDGGDAPKMKVVVLRQMKGSIAEGVYVERLLQLVEQAVSDERQEFAEEHIAELLGAARKSNDYDLTRRATLCVLKVQEMKSQ